MVKPAIGTTGPDLGPRPSQEARPHIAYFDWIRACGCVAVILIHLCAVYAGMASVDDMGFCNAVRNMFIPTVLARWAVPLFFMVTGALLLDPHKPLTGHRLLGYVGRMLAVMATFGVAFSLAKSLMADGPLNAGVVATALLGVLNGNAWGHLWYIASLIGLYVVTPVLRSFTEKADVRSVEIALIVLYVLGCIVPFVNAVSGLALTTFFVFPFEIFYYLLGYYAHRLIESGTLAKTFGDPMRPIAFSGAASLIIMLLAIVVHIRHLHGDGYIFTDPVSCFVGPYSLLVFMLFKRFADRPVRPGSPVDLLSRHCLGVYLVHPVFTRLIKLFDLQLAYMALPPLVGESLFTVGILLLTATCVWILNRTRFCREFLRL